MRLEVTGLCAGYGKLQVLRGVDLAVGAGECVAIVGPNGAGKSTLLNTVAGLHAPTFGTVTLDGMRIDGQPAHRIVRRGMTIVPEGRHLFGEMTVLENLDLARRVGTARGSSRTVADVLDLFPALAGRARRFAGRLSGGEQQMVAIGRALMLGADLILLDEPSTGLAPRVLREIMDVVGTLVSDGVGVLIVEQNVRELARIADRAYVLEGGRTDRAGPAADLLDTDALRRSFLAVREAVRGPGGGT